MDATAESIESIKDLMKSIDNFLARILIALVRASRALDTIDAFSESFQQNYLEVQPPSSGTWWQSHSIMDRTLLPC